MASRLRRVSSRDSPLVVADVLMAMFNTSADRRLAASSKVVRVRVLGSKNRLATVLPLSSGTFLMLLSFTLVSDSAVSSMETSMSRGRPSMVRKCLSLPAGVSWMDDISLSR